MLVAATTVKDTVAHLERYVRGNLAGGLDHLVVFLDAPGAPGQAEARAFLEEQEQVTCVPAGRGWWGEGRPAELNRRQCTNANLVKHLLAQAGCTGPEDWIFHIDGDEVVRLDRALLAGLPPERTAVQLAVREVVSRERWDAVPDLFKRELTGAELDRLRTRGLIAEADNRAYFHGHLQGKAGARPGAPVWLTLHRAVSESGAVVEGLSHPDLEVFHFESYSGEEFVRKWTAILDSGPRVAHRPGRAEFAREIAAVVRSTEPEDVRRGRFMELYRAHIEDDVAALTEAGVLLQVDVTQPVASPAAVDGSVITALRDSIEAMRGRPKDEFFHGASTKNGRVLGAGVDPKRGGRVRSALRRGRSGR